MSNKKENHLPKKGAKLLLNVFSTVAERNAATLCKGLMYEPDVPKKLKR